MNNLKSLRLAAAFLSAGACSALVQAEPAEAVQHNLELYRLDSRYNGNFRD